MTWRLLCTRLYITILSTHASALNIFFHFLLKSFHDIKVLHIAPKKISFCSNRRYFVNYLLIWTRNMDLHLMTLKVCNKHFNICRPVTICLRRVFCLMTRSGVWTQICLQTLQQATIFLWPGMMLWKVSKLIITCRLWVVNVRGDTFLMYRFWLHGLNGLHGPRCPLSDKIH